VCFFSLERYREAVRRALPDASANEDPVAAFRDREYESAEAFLLAGTLACVAFAEREGCAVLVTW